MKYWVFEVESGAAPHTKRGWVRAASAEEAFKMIGEPDANAILCEVPDDSGFPELSDGPIAWDDMRAGR